MKGVAPILNLILLRHLQLSPDSSRGLPGSPLMVVSKDYLFVNVEEMYVGYGTERRNWRCGIGGSCENIG